MVSEEKLYSLKLHESIDFTTQTGEVVTVLRVIGGWLYTVSYIHDGGQVGLSTTFVKNKKGV